MLAVSASREVIEKALVTQGLSSCHVSCMNVPDLSVISGPLKDVEIPQGSFQALQTRPSFSNFLTPYIPRRSTLFSQTWLRTPEASILLNLKFQ